MNTVDKGGKCARNYLFFIGGGHAFLTSLVAVGYALTYELGYPIQSPLAGPVDRFSDSIKIGLSYKSLVAPHINPAWFHKWPAIFQQYYLNNPYGGTDALAAGALTHFHLPPLSTLIYMMSGYLSAVLFSPSGVLGLFFVAYLVLIGIAIRVAVPERPQTVPFTALLYYLFLLSYPALFMLGRGNFIAGLTALCLTAFLVATLGSKKCGWISALFMAVALNTRPNTAVFLAALPIAFGLRGSIKPFVRIVALAGLLFGVSLIVDNWVYPEYTFAAFRKGYSIYHRLYVLGGWGDAFNSSLFAASKTVAILIIKMTGWRIFTVNGVLLFSGAMGGMLIVATLAVFLLRRVNGSSASFLIAAVYALTTPVFGDYHLLVFVVPIIMVYLELAETGSDPISRSALVISIASVLLLLPKNFYVVEYIQRILNPMLMLATASYLLGTAWRADVKAMRHVNLRSADGAEIAIDYTSAFSETVQLWINVSGEKLAGVRNVQVVLINLYRDDIYAGAVQDTQYVGLMDAGGNKYTGQAKNVALPLGGAGASYYFRQEIAVKITTVTPSGEQKEEWLTDPVSGSHNFKFELSRF